MKGYLVVWFSSLLETPFDPWVINLNFPLASVKSDTDTLDYWFSQDPSVDPCLYVESIPSLKEESFRPILALILPKSVNLLSLYCGSKLCPWISGIDGSCV